MALNLCFLSTQSSSLPFLAHRNVVFKDLVSVRLTQKTKVFASPQISDPTVERRSANYLPSMLDYNFVESLESDYADNTHASRRGKLVEKVRRLLEEIEVPSARLEFIDDLQRLGVGYIFEKEINCALHDASFFNNEKGTWDLHSTALRFRLLRQHGHEVSQDVFNSFKDEKECFKASLCEDPKGLLSLYEASYLALEGEPTLDEAREFASKNLQCLNGNISQELAKMVTHSLDLPLHWRIQRSEARWYIDTCERKEKMNPILLELAKLDYNMVQGAYQGEIKECLRWWKNLGLREKFDFFRDRLTECYLWGLGIKFDPQFSLSRIELAKVNQLITMLDDVYDLYGTLDELELFTDVVDRWDVNAIEGLPEYMKLCFLALYNTINETGYEILKGRGLDIIPYLKKQWADLCKAYMVEAKWYHNGYRPSVEEYLKNAVASISTPVILSHAYICVTQEITKEALDALNNGSDLIYCSAMVLRLMDDLGTSTDEMERGDIPKSIQCYMQDAGVSEAIAREYINNMVSDMWKKMNKEVLSSSSPFPQVLKDCATNLARMSIWYYQYGDGFGIANYEKKDRVMLLLAEPVPLKEI